MSFSGKRRSPWGSGRMRESLTSKSRAGPVLLGKIIHYFLGNINIILSILGCLIFSEIMILHFCNLDKNTIDKTAKRSKMEIEIIVSGKTNILNDTLYTSDIN